MTQLEKGLSRIRTASPGNRPGDVLFKNVKLECASVEDVNQMLNQISLNIEAELRSRSIETRITDPPRNQQHIIDRLVKVGRKRFIPSYLKERLRSKNVTELATISTDQILGEVPKNQPIYSYPFKWEKFKNYQKIFLHTIDNALVGVVTEDDFNRKIKFYQENLQKQEVGSSTSRELDILQKSAKFFLYKDWQYSYDENAPNQYKLVSRAKEVDRYILVTFDREKNRVIVSTKKPDFNDAEIVAIMLEISRNAQRFANSYNQNIRVHGLNENSAHDAQRIIQFRSLAGWLQQGIDSSKDEQKKGFEFDIVR